MQEKDCLMSTSKKRSIPLSHSFSRIRNKSFDKIKEIISYYKLSGRWEWSYDPCNTGQITIQDAGANRFIVPELKNQGYNVILSSVE